MAEPSSRPRSETLMMLTTISHLLRRQPGPLGGRPTTAVRVGLTIVGLIVTCSCIPNSSIAAQLLRVVEPPVLTIGAGADTNAEFVSIAAVARLSDGTVAVSTVRPAEIRLFSPAGAFIRLVAGGGAGPGELQSPMWFGRQNDALFAYDFSLSRITTFDVRHQSVKTLTFAPSSAGTRMFVTGHVGPDSWLVASAPAAFPTRHADGPYRDSAIVAVWRNDSLPLIPVGRFANLALFAYNDDHMAATSNAFDRLRANTSFLAANGFIWVGDSDQNELLLYGSSGELARRIPVPVAARRYSEDGVKRLASTVLSQVRRATDSARTLAMFDLSHRRSLAPAYSRLIPGARSWIWVEVFEPDPAASTEYVAIDTSGKVGWRLRTPKGVRFFQIDDDFALGVRRSAEDLQSVVLYRLAH